jgi:MoaA/NifB/PqqE/SkfB family radical SAM enzyme
MCPQAKGADGKPGRHKDFLKKMSLEEFEKNVADCAKHGLRVVNLDGSGEATLNRNLPEYIKIVTKYGCESVIFSNGFNMSGQFMRDCVDAGLTFFRFSIIGSNPSQYLTWMNSMNFATVIQNAKDMVAYVKESGAKCTVGTYHLITDTKYQNEQLEQYKAIVEDIGCVTEIWRMHNWSGIYKPLYNREGEKKTCGRPFSPDVVIRAGGLDGQRGAVAPCCQVLGRDEEAVLGHTSENTIEEIWYGEEYTKLRDGHTSGDYPDYCKGCDFLIDDTEVLVYTNHGRSRYHMYGTEFTLNEYRK